ncbi:histidine kinase [Pseudonocardia sp.]|uniref:histidine kinase n=1 Tax=Pseudonocardia sp. TaxID=60912 RepID=UPI003D103B90
MPDLVEPMLAGSGEFPGGPDWSVEFAWEGLRVVAHVTAQRVRLRSSSGRSLASIFPDLETALRAVAPRGGVILDGTVVAQGPSGTPRRRALQSRAGTFRPSEALMRRVPVAFLVGDVLWHDGRSTLDLPYRARRELAEGLRTDEPAVWLTPTFPATELGPVMHAADQHGVDALFARQLDAPYRPGRRSRHFLRLPVRRVRQVVVGGFSPADPRRPESAIGALLLGVPETGGLRYVGRAGLRDAADRGAVAAALPGLRRAHSPFTAPLPREIAESAVWMAPQLVGRVEYADRMPDGRLRLPTWRGLVPDGEIDPAQLVEVTPAPPAEPTPDATAVRPAAEPPAAPPAESPAGTATRPAPGPAAEPAGEQAGATRGAHAQPTDEAAAEPITDPTAEPTDEPTAEPTDEPTAEPTDEPTAEPTDEPTDEPTADPTIERRRLEQHFFYNSLNTIASVIRTDPARARDLLLGFADLNRATDRTAATTTLGEELAAVRAYLQLEQARFGKRLRVDVDVDEALHALALPPLALLEAVRATVQERIEPRPEGGTLVVRAALRGECTIAVDGDPPHSRVPVGPGSA